MQSRASPAHSQILSTTSCPALRKLRRRRGYHERRHDTCSRLCGSRLDVHALTALLVLAKVRGWEEGTQAADSPRRSCAAAPTPAAAGGARRPAALRPSRPKTSRRTRLGLTSLTSPRCRSTDVRVSLPEPCACTQRTAAAASADASRLRVRSTAGGKPSRAAARDSRASRRRQQPADVSLHP
jgi:hypothetical protein